MSWIRRRRLAKQVDGWIRTNIGPASIILSQVCRPAITESDRPVLFLTPGKRGNRKLTHYRLVQYIVCSL